ncbi:LOW QUALITY PROTEIN: collagen alpha-1(IX) chain-like [Pholidichthys leucotaenia]
MGGAKRNILLYSLCCCYMIPQSVCTGLHSQTVRISSQVGIHLEQQSTCPQISTGDYHFPGFYIMSQFHIAELARRDTIKRLLGPSPHAVAYQLGPAFSFRINSRSAHPLGLPEEFAFVAVLRMTGSTVDRSWSVWQTQDVNGDEQLAVRLNWESKSLEFSFTAQNTGRQTVAFSQPGFLFSHLWHSVFLEIKWGSVALLVDCVTVGSRDMPPRQEITLDGFRLIGKLKGDLVVTVLFELQSMLIHCDVTGARAEACNHLPVMTSVRMKETH